MSDSHNVLDLTMSPMEACLHKLLTQEGYRLKDAKYTRSCSHGSVVISCSINNGTMAIKAKTKPLEKHTRDSVFHSVGTKEQLEEIVQLLHI